MLFIFRKLRRSFFPLRQGSEGHVLPGKVRTYCAYAFGEIALIMAGILLALQVSDWNQERKDRAEETEILVRLKEEMEASQRFIEGQTETYRKTSADMRKAKRGRKGKKGTVLVFQC